MTMTTEETVSTAPETQKPAQEPAKQDATSAGMESTGDDSRAADSTETAEAEKAEKTPEQKELERLRRQLTKAQRNNARLYSEAEQLRQYVPRQESEQQAEPVDPHALAREIATVERVTEKANGIAKDGEKRFGAEFKTALSAVVDEAGALFDNRGRPTAIGDAILDADDPAALLHHLGKNPDLAAELQDLSPARLGRRIGQIEAQMSAKPAPKPVSGAPAPAKPIGAASSGNTNPANMNMAEYKAYRKSQGASWSR